MPDVGADLFNGYEVSLTTNGRKVIITGHQQDFRPLTEVQINFNPKKWNVLRAKIEEKEIEIFLNDNNIYHFKRNDVTLKNGIIAFHTWKSDVAYRNIQINDNCQTLRPEFQSLPVIT